MKAALGAAGRCLPADGTAEDGAIAGLGQWAGGIESFFPLAKTENALPTPLLKHCR